MKIPVTVYEQIASFSGSRSKDVEFLMNVQEIRQILRGEKYKRIGNALYRVSVV